MPIRPDETGQRYFERFERNWDLDPDTELCVRKRTLSPAPETIVPTPGKQQLLRRRYQYLGLAAWTLGSAAWTANSCCKSSDDDHTQRFYNQVTGYIKEEVATLRRLGELLQNDRLNTETRRKFQNGSAGVRSNSTTTNINSIGSTNALR